MYGSRSSWLLIVFWMNKFDLTGEKIFILVDDDCCLREVN